MTVVPLENPLAELRQRIGDLETRITAMELKNTEQILLTVQSINELRKWVERLEQKLNARAA